jgi:hypothetical protein
MNVVQWLTSLSPAAMAGVLVVAGVLGGGLVAGGVALLKR